MELFEMMKTITTNHSRFIFTKEALELLRKYRDESLLPEEKDEILNVGLISFSFGSIAALYSFLATSAIEWPLNESTIIPFLSIKIRPGSDAATCCK